MEERHRLSLIIATLGPSTDDPQELKTMIIAGIARQWTDGVDIARILHSDGESVSKDRAEKFREESEKRKCNTSIYLDTDERRRFAQGRHEYLIEQIQSKEETISSTTMKIEIPFNHPVKELIWVIQDDRWVNNTTATASTDSNRGKRYDK